MKPKRIQRKRTKGWRMPANTVYVRRGSKWGNPFRVVRIKDCCGVGYHVLDKDGYGEADFDTPKQAAEYACELYLEEKTKENNDFIAVVKRELKGKDLACWCALDQPCHADVLLELANEKSEE